MAVRHKRALRQLLDDEDISKADFDALGKDPCSRKGGRMTCQSKRGNLGRQRVGRLMTGRVSGRIFPYASAENAPLGAGSPCLVGAAVPTLFPRRPPRMIDTHLISRTSKVKNRKTVSAWRGSEVLWFQ